MSIKKTIRIAAMAVLCAMLVSATGCKDSDVLKEIIYDQSASIEEQNTDQSIWVFDQNSDYVTDELPEYATENIDQSLLNMQPRALYSSEAGTDYTAAQFLYNNPADYDCESTGFVTFVPATDAQQQENDQQQTDENAQEKSDIGGNGSQDTTSNTAGSNVSDTSTNYSDQGANKGAGENGNTTVIDSGNSNNGQTTKKTDLNDPYSEIPAVNSVAAYGAAAVIVDMVAGSGPLVAADSDTLTGNFASVFGTTGIATGWNGDGSSNTQVDIAAIIAAKPDTVLVYQSDYFTAEQDSALAAAGISVTVIPSLKTQAGIKNCVTLIATMLKTSTAKTVDDPAGVATKYCNWHDQLVSDIESANGGYTAPYDGTTHVVFDNDVSVSNFSSTASYTLLIDAWDYNATYMDSYSGFSPVAYQGVGFSTAGYTSSPVSYYLGVGGAVNNAAAESTWTDYEINHEAVVWQFPFSALNANASYWNYDSATSPFADSIQLPGSGGRKELLRKMSDWSSTDDESGGSNGLGNTDFPAVIVTTQKMKNAFIADSAANGIYHAYPVVAGNPSYVGVDCNGLALSCCIGQQGGGQYTVFSSTGDLSNCIIVNPAGLCSSWTTGSPESVLESAWAASCGTFVSGNGLDANWLYTKMADFYSEFYRYNLTSDDFNTMMAGEVE